MLSGNQTWPWRITLWNLYDFPAMVIMAAPICQARATMRPNKVPVRAGETSENVYHRSMPGVKNYHPEECLFLYLSCPICNSPPPKKKTRCSQRFSQQVTIPVGWFSSSQLLIGLIGDLLERMKWNACARARRIKWIVEIWWGMIVLYNSYSQTLMLCWDNFASYSSAPHLQYTYIYIYIYSINVRNVHDPGLQDWHPSDHNNSERVLEIPHFYVWGVI